MDKKSVYIYSTAMCDAINVAGEITFKREKKYVVAAHDRFVLKNLLNFHQLEVSKIN